MTEETQLLENLKYVGWSFQKFQKKIISRPKPGARLYFYYIIIRHLAYLVFTDNLVTIWILNINWHNVVSFLSIYIKLDISFIIRGRSSVNSPSNFQHNVQVITLFFIEHQFLFVKFATSLWMRNLLHLHNTSFQYSSNYYWKQRK